MGNQIQHAASAIAADWIESRFARETDGNVYYVAVLESAMTVVQREILRWCLNNYTGSRIGHLFLRLDPERDQHRLNHVMQTLTWFVRRYPFPKIAQLNVIGVLAAGSTSDLQHLAFPVHQLVEAICDNSSLTSVSLYTPVLLKASLVSRMVEKHFNALPMDRSNVTTSDEPGDPTLDQAMIRNNSSYLAVVSTDDKVAITLHLTKQDNAQVFSIAAQASKAEQALRLVLSCMGDWKLGLIVVDLSSWAVASLIEVISSLHDLELSALSLRGAERTASRHIIYDPYALRLFLPGGLELFRQCLRFPSLTEFTMGHFELTDATPVSSSDHGWTATEQLATAAVDAPWNVTLYHCELGRGAWELLLLRPLTELHLHHVLRMPTSKHDTLLTRIQCNLDGTSLVDLTEIDLAGAQLGTDEMGCLCHLLTRASCRVAHLKMGLLSWEGAFPSLADAALEFFFESLPQMRSLISLSIWHSVTSESLTRVILDGIKRNMSLHELDCLQFDELVRDSDAASAAFVEVWQVIRFWLRCNVHGRSVLQVYVQDPTSSIVPRGLLARVLHRGFRVDVQYEFLRLLMPSLAYTDDSQEDTTEMKVL